jgi:hypothetical protein
MNGLGTSLVWGAVQVSLFCLVGAIIIVFALTDGWDLGIGILSPFIGHTDDERRMVLRSIEPNWEGNQTWLNSVSNLSLLRIYEPGPPHCTSRENRGKCPQ